MAIANESTNPQLRGRALSIKLTAVRLFSDKGFEATSMREIARAVDIKPASLYNHFTSKEAILWTICREGMAVLHEGADAALSVSADPLEQLRAFVRQHIDYHISCRRAALVIDRQTVGLTRRHQREIAEVRSAYAQKLRDLLEEGLAAGRFQLPCSRLAASAILAMGTEVATWYRQSDPLSSEQIVAAYETLVVQMVGVSEREPSAQ